MLEVPGGLALRLHANGEDLPPAPAWDALADASRYVNPFYERWNLVPALRHLDPRRRVRLAAVYRGDTLAALFPYVQRHRVLPGLQVWAHPHCFLSDPLCLSGIDLGPVLDRLAVYYRSRCWHFGEHSPGAYGSLDPRRSVCHYRSRGAIADPGRLPEHLTGLPGKLRRENRRVVARLRKARRATYEVVSDEGVGEALDRFCALELAGWKGRTGCAIDSTERVGRYYREIVALAPERVRVQLLRDSGGELLAAAFRYVSRGQGFDIKTCYDERWRALYPGVVLELMDLEVLPGAGLKRLDSCTAPDNRVVNRLWPDRRTTAVCRIHADTAMGRLAAWGYRLYRRLRRGG